MCSHSVIATYNERITPNKYQCIIRRQLPIISTYNKRITPNNINIQQEDNSEQY